MTARGQMYREHVGVYAVGHRADVALGAETAALLACGEGALLSHRAAGAAWGLAVGGAIDVTVPDRRTGRPDGVTVHRTRTLARHDVRVHLGLPITSPARTLLDLADVVGPRELERALDEALVARLVRQADLHDVLARATGRRGAPALRRLVEHRGGAGPTVTRSEAEERFLGLIRAARLPAPRVNARVAGYEVDFLWPQERVVVEIDGYQFHRGRAAFERDRRKGAALAAAGLMVIRATWLQMAQEPLALVASVAQTLARAA